MEHSDNLSNTSLPEEQMPSDSASVSSVVTPISMYQEELQHSRFNLLEGQFKMRRITSQESKFYILGCHLPPHILKKVAHVVGEMPKENPFDNFKRELLARTSNSEEQPKTIRCATSNAGTGTKSRHGRTVSPSLLVRDFA